MKLYSWGANTYGQLSHGVQSEQCIYPTGVLSSNPLEEISAVAAGGGHTLVLDSSGRVHASGSNSHGQLGNCHNNTTVLSEVTALQEFHLVQIECGWDSSYAITEDGLVVAWGSNKFGQLGIPKEKVTTSNHPVVLQTPHITQVSAGLRHIAMVSSDGHVFVCGRANKGQLGVTGSEGAVPKTDVDSFVRVEGLEGVKEVACGQHHTLALTSDGHLLGWGDNKWGQLGQGDVCFPTPRLLTTLEGSETTIRAGWTHSAVLSGGRIRSWGRNGYNQLGHSCGHQLVNKLDQLTELHAVKQLALGSEHTLALLDNGEVWSWGWNEHGSCGTGTVESVPVPQRVSVPSPVSGIAAGGGHSLALCME